MKKLMVALACAGLSTAAFAQETVEIAEVPTQKYSVATNSFWSNWFIQLGGTYNNYINAGTDFSDQMFKKDYTTWGAHAALGKWFTPGMGLRAKLNAWETKANKDKSKYGYLHGDAMFNLSNIFCGYSETRVWNFTPFVGAGILRNCSEDNYTPALNAGLNSTWRFGKHVAFYLEGSIVAFRRDWDHVNGGKENGLWNGYDKMINLEAGLTFNLGKATWSKVPDVDALMAMNAAQLEALNASLAEQQAENARLKAELANEKNKPVVTAPASTPKGDCVSAPQSIFFKLNSAKISKQELVNLEAIAATAKANSSNVTVTGYADSATGNSSINQRLSDKRAEAVANKLAEYGVSRDKISTKGDGGVATLNPSPFNRRAIVELK